MRGNRGFVFSAHKIKLQLRFADLRQHCLQQLAVGFGQALAEKPAGNPDAQAVVIQALEPRRAEPGSETVRIDAPFGMLKNLVPKVHRSKSTLTAISTGVEMLWKPHALGGEYVCLAFQVRCCGNAPPRRNS